MFLEKRISIRKRVNKRSYVEDVCKGYLQADVTTSLTKNKKHQYTINVYKEHLYQMLQEAATVYAF
jgi:hypothetical protein